LWTATIAFPVSVSAFAPLWVSAVFAGAMLTFTIYFSRGKSKSFRNLESAEHE